MKPASAAKVWMAAILLAALAIAATIALGWNRPAIAFSLGEAKIAVVGSSLMKNAVPPDTMNGGLLGDGRPHIRVGVPGITESESLTAFGQVVAAHPDVVLLEANAFVIDLGERGSESKTPTWWASNVGLPFRRGIDRLQGKNYAVDLSRENDLTKIFKPRPAQLARLYPLKLHALTDPAGFARVVNDAKAHGVRVVLVVPPRSKAAETVMGSDNRAAVQSAYEQLAASYGIELWVFGPDWPNNLFADHAHLNGAGRERFVDELRHRYEAAP